METNRKPHLIWLMAIENLFENNQRDNYITTRQMCNQWRQIESLVLFGSWTKKKLLHEDKQRDNYYNHETKIQPVETNRKPHLIWLMDIEKESPSLEMTRETIIQPEDKCTTNGDK